MTGYCFEKPEETALTRQTLTRRSLAGTALALPFVRRAYAELGQVVIAKQFGTLYLQQDVMERHQLVEKHAGRLGLPGLRTSYVKLGGTGPVTEALLSGSLHFASGGAPGALLLWDRTRGAVKSAFAMNASNQRLLTVGPATSVAELKPEDRIALPAAKVSPQAIYLQMAAAQAFGAAEWAKLDPQTISRAHPDSAAQMIGRTEINCHFSTTPFQERELKAAGVREITNSYSIQGVTTSTPNTIYAQSSFRTENPLAWQATLAAFDEATNWINQYPMDAAQLYLDASGEKDTADNVQAGMQAPGNRFTLQPANVQFLANFMTDCGTLKRRPQNLADLFFPEAVERGGS